MTRQLVTTTTLFVAAVILVVLAVLGAYDVATPAQRTVAVIGIMAVIVAGITSWAYGRRLTSRLGELRSVASALAGGNFSRRPQLAAPGPVGDVSEALHLLGEQLDARMSALQAEEELSRAFFDALNEGVMAVSARRDVVRINDAGRRLLGVSEPVPFPFERLPRDRSLREAVDAAIAGETRDPAEIVVAGRTVALTARPLRGGAVVALFDLTAIRRLERVRSDFVANVSHELKTPLTVIGGFAETLLDDDLPPDRRRQFAGTIRSNSVRMQRLVDDLLDLSRIESGGWIPAQTWIEVEPLLQELAASFRAEADRKGIRVEVDVAAGATRAWADPTALRQITTNLLENAVRYTHAGTVTLFASPDDAGGAWVGVTDTGIGIPNEHLTRIFERFYRVDPARSRSLGGTGLGLSIVRHLTEAHGGKIRAESSVGQGTTVAALFPPA
jgi:two-component system, OmpR family, phosphate regulon sensor histidine kinase PhoR